MSEKTFEFNGHTFAMPKVNPVVYRIGITVIAAEIIRQQKMVEHAQVVVSCFEHTPANEVAA